jgi:hypothetical protein
MIGGPSMVTQDAGRKAEPSRSVLRPFVGNNDATLRNHGVCLEAFSNADVVAIGHGPKPAAGMVPQLAIRHDLATRPNLL